jgi:predicted ribosomally synthesized peptide with nif11-like leader
MSKQGLDAFRGKLENDESLRSQMKHVLSAGGTKSTATLDELVEFAKAHGYAFSTDEVFGSLELSDTELDRVVGGTSDPKDFGDWIADVERPSETFRSRYQLRLAETPKLLSSK